MCSIVRYRYRCGCSHTAVFQCPRTGDANQQRPSNEYVVHGCSHQTTDLDEPCQDCETDPCGGLGQPGVNEDAGAHQAELAMPMDGQYAIEAGGDHGLENVDPNQADDAEPHPTSDDGHNGDSNEPPAPRRSGRRVLGEITLNLI